ncbi:MAG: lipoyl(octanoyl) transferase LipB [Gammaproteobacteria bacterium]|nr:lipoyl(octanoyl) transferase LipB [Gammaproteobacteria bacterium]MDH3369738.1 lipoyl(octanoyl) transferase LipB [Gammaproteobacteria bacterium]MDH3405395.1 lipoyl(octanoyl) transferase LipB [Gammaproteobacteria bacterium]MDH3563729.1 lipoyl(octanoyl) transferase LipB [Gammaproteobacteria bacterium]MDH5487588.1 lipoyl(octanoyl) transferase LipB [Gammaproteobacteria bacterium]
MQSARHLASFRTVTLRTLGRVDYVSTFRAMQAFSIDRTSVTPDEIWLLEHPPVFTMGLKGRDGTRTDIDGIPLVYTDRGGDITYHGPGQLVAYLLMDLARRGFGPKPLVRAMEQAIINLLADHGIVGERHLGAPGVYTAQGKIAALGLRVKQGRSYHGLALNINMDLAPYSRIHPCGYPGQPVTQLADLGIHVKPATIGRELIGKLTTELGYTDYQPESDDFWPIHP